MSVSDSASTSGEQRPADAVMEVKPDMFAFMEEMREHMHGQDRTIAALQQAVAVMAAPAGGNGTGPRAAVAAAVDAAAGPPVNRGTARWHPPRSHDLLPYREDAAETMDGFFTRFERYCTAEYRGTMDDALPLIRSKLSGRILDIFDANGPGTPYPVIKRRMLEWDSRQRDCEAPSAVDAYRDAARRPGESLAVYAFRLAALFEDATRKWTNR